MSNYDLRPHVNRAERMPDYSTGSGGYGLWILVFGAIVVVLFATMFFSSGGDTTLGAPDGTPIGAPDVPGLAAAPGTPQPAATGE